MIQLTTLKRYALPLAAIIFGLVIVLWASGRYHQGKLTDLKTENARIADSYNQQLGVAKANELAAREEAMKATALVEAVEQGNRNVAALEIKLEAVKGSYEAAKNEMGGCADTNDCLDRLRAELKAAGFKID